MFELSDDVPYPASFSIRGGYKYPLGAMKIGQSFLGSRNAVVAAHMRTQREKELKFKSAREGDLPDGSPAYRIWRIA